jgi:hypothetical protein
MEHIPAGRQPLESIDSILDSFFASTCIGKKIPTGARYLRVGAHLRDYLETEGERILCPEDAELLDLERSFDPDSAFARLFGADVLAGVAAAGASGPKNTG